MGSGDGWLREASLYTMDQLRLIKGFNQVIQAAHAQGFHGGIDGGKSSHENDLCEREELLDGVPQHEPV